MSTVTTIQSPHQARNDSEKAFVLLRCPPMIQTANANSLPRVKEICRRYVFDSMSPSSAAGKRNREISTDSSCLPTDEQPAQKRPRSCERHDDTKNYVNKDGVSPSSVTKTPLTKREATWEEKFCLLVEYKKKHKSTNVLERKSKLFGWIHTQRTRYKQKTLSEYRFQKLNALGFDWQIFKYLPWTEMYNQLLDYKEKHNGSTCVSKTSLTYDKLGRWVYHQRALYKNGRLSPKRVDILESIGFKWRIHEDTPWIGMYQRLVSYTKEHGTTRVPYHYPDDRKLGRWVQAQRRACKEKSCVDLLNAIGFAWDGKRKNPLPASY